MKKVTRRLGDGSNGRGTWCCQIARASKEWASSRTRESKRSITMLSKYRNLFTKEWNTSKKEGEEEEEEATLLVTQDKARRYTMDGHLLLWRDEGSPHRAHGEEESNGWNCLASNTPLRTQFAWSKNRLSKGAVQYSAWTQKVGRGFGTAKTQRWNIAIHSYGIYTIIWGPFYRLLMPLT